VFEAGRTIRVTTETYEMLRDLAAKADTTIVAALEKAVREYYREKYWEEVDAGYARLRADSEAWAEYQEELRTWDCTLMDGLEDWPYE
jgi:hypothetical protein